MTFMINRKHDQGGVSIYFFSSGCQVFELIKPVEGLPCSGDYVNLILSHFWNPFNLCPRRGSGNFLLYQKKSKRIENNYI